MNLLVQGFERIGKSDDTYQFGSRLLKLLFEFFEVIESLMKTKFSDSSSPVKTETISSSSSACLAILLFPTRPLSTPYIITLNFLLDVVVTFNSRVSYHWLRSSSKDQKYGWER